MKALKIQTYKQNQESFLFRSQIFNLETVHPSNWVSLLLRHLLFEKEKLTTAFGALQAENAELKSDVKALIIQAYSQDQGIVLLKSQISNLETAHPY